MSTSYEKFLRSKVKLAQSYGKPVDRLAATGIWGEPRMVLGSPLWKRERVIETIENGELKNL